MAKFSFARLRQDHLAELDNLSEESRKFIHKLYDKPSMFINTAQLYIILLIVFVSYEGLMFLLFMKDLVSIVLGLEGQWQDSLALLLNTILLATIILVFGETIPKSLGLSFPEKYISFSAKLVHKAGLLLYPFIWIADKMSRALVKPFNTKFSSEVDLVHTEEEIRLLVNRSHLGGTIDTIESELIDNVFDFVDRLAKEVMVPRQDMVCLYLEDDFEENMNIVRHSKHSRYPLCMEDKDHILGLVHVKDIMDAQELGPVDFRNIRREILTVPEVMKVSNLLQYMRKRRTYFAVVVDEYGGTVGMVGLEDIIAELVGDIQDENEDQRDSIVDLHDGAYEFDGKVLVDDVEDILHMEINDVEEDTIGGFVFGVLGRTPEVKDTIESGHYKFTVLEVQGYRITRVKAEPLEKEKTTGED